MGCCLLNERCPNVISQTFEMVKGSTVLFTFWELFHSFILKLIKLLHVKSNRLVVSMDYSIFMYIIHTRENCLMKLAVTRKDLEINKETVFLL